MIPLLFVLGVLSLRVVGARPVEEDVTVVEERPTLTVRAATTSFPNPFAVPTYSFSFPTYSYSFSFPTYSYSFSIPTYSYSFPTYYSIPTYSYSIPTYSYSFPTYDPGTSTGGGTTFNLSTGRRTSTRTIVGAVVGSVVGFLSLLGAIWAAIKRRARKAMGKPAAGDEEKPPVVMGSNVPPLGYTAQTQQFEQAPLLPPETQPLPSQPHRPPAPYIPTTY